MTTKTKKPEVTEESEINKLRKELRAVKAKISLEKQKAVAGLDREEEINTLVEAQVEIQAAINAIVEAEEQAKRQAAIDATNAKSKAFQEEALKITPGMLDFLTDDPEQRCRIIAFFLGSLQTMDIYGESFANSQYVKIQLAKDAGGQNPDGNEMRVQEEANYERLVRNRERVIVLRHYFENEFDRAYAHLDIEHIYNPPVAYNRSDQETRLKAQKTAEDKAAARQAAYLELQKTAGNVALMLEGKLVESA